MVTQSQWIASAGSNTAPCTCMRFMYPQFICVCRVNSMYIVMLGAVANIISTSLHLVQNAVLAWGGTTIWVLLLWTSLPCAIHVTAASSYWHQTTKVRSGKRAKEVLTSNATPTHTPLRARLAQVSKAEFIICANQDKLASRNDKSRAPKPIALLNILAGIMGFIHVPFGNMLFSSLQFMTMWDVLNRILVRYLASTFASMLVLCFEFGGLREHESVHG